MAEMRLKGISTLEEANRFLKGFLVHYNRRFAVPAAEEGSAWRSLPGELDLEKVFSFKHHRVVAADNTVQFGPKRLQVLPSPERASYVRAAVEVCEHLDGSLAVYYEGHKLKVREAPLEAPALRSRSGEAMRQKASSTLEVPVPRKAPAPSTWGRNFKLPGSRPNSP